MPIKLEKDGVTFIFQGFEDRLPENASGVIAAIGMGSNKNISTDEIERTLKGLINISKDKEKDLWLIYPGDGLVLKNLAETEGLERFYIEYSLVQNLQNSFIRPGKFYWYLPLFGVTLGKKGLRRIPVSRRTFVKVGATGGILLFLLVSGCLSEEEVRKIDVKLRPLFELFYAERKELAAINHAIAAKKVWTSLVPYYKVSGAPLNLCILCPSSDDAELLKGYLEDQKKVESTIAKAEKVLSDLSELYGQFEKEGGLLGEESHAVFKEIGKSIKEGESLRLFCGIHRWDPKKIVFYKIEYKDSWTKVIESETEFWKKQLGK